MTLYGYAMKVIEQFTRGKSGDEAKNEDRIAVTDDFIALFDGVTSRAGFLLKGVSTGRFAVDVLSETLGKIPAGISPSRCVVYRSNT